MAIDFNILKPLKKIFGNPIDVSSNQEGFRPRMYLDNLGVTPLVVDNLGGTFATISNRLPTTAEVITLVSSSASDTQVVTIRGLDENLDVVTDTVTLTGTTGVSTTQTFLRFFDASVETGGSNIGTITISFTAGSTGIIPIGAGYTVNGIVTIPNGYVGSLLTLGYSISKNVQVDVKVRFRLPVWDNFQVRAEYFLNQNNIMDNIRPVFKVPAGTDLCVTAFTESGSTEISALFNIIWEPTS